MSEKAAAQTASSAAAPAVDPRPHAAPIMLGSAEYVFAPAQASDAETLALKPNTAAEATEGPHEQIDPNSYVRMTKPDGSEFLSPLSNVEHYTAKGYKAGASEEIPDLVAYHSEHATQAP